MPSCCTESGSCHEPLQELYDDVYVTEGWDVSYTPEFMGCCCSGAYYFSAVDLPDGLSIDPQTGTISGTLGYDFANQDNSPVILSSTIRLHQQDSCAGETIEATGTIYWHIYDNNRLPTASSFSLENRTDSSRHSSPRTKDLLEFTVGQVSDPDGDPVLVTIEWQVNGQTVQTTTGTESYFDLSVPDHGDVGDTITVIVKLNDGSGDFEVYSTTVTVDNTPPVVTSIVVEGEQAFEDNVFYFVEGQEATIRIRVQDDDLEQSPGRETVRVSLAEGALPPGLEFEGPDYVEVDETGEAVIRGTIQPHGGYQPTQYYLPRFRAWDNAGSDALSPFVALAATDFRITEFYFKDLPANHSSENRIRIRRSATDVTRFTMLVKGVGAAADGTSLYWTVFEDDTLNNDELWFRRSVTVSSSEGDGSFTHEITFYLFANGSTHIAGPDDDSGEASPDGIYGRLERWQTWYGFPDWQWLADTSNVLWLEGVE